MCETNVEEEFSPRLKAKFPDRDGKLTERCHKQWSQRGFSYLQSISLKTLRGKTALAPLFVTALSQFPVSVGKFNFKPGTELFFNIGFAYPLFRDIEFLGQINFHYQDRVSVGHAPGVEQPDTGRETLFLSPGIRYQLTKNIHLYTLAQFPVYQRVNGIQITSDWNLTTGVSFRFNLPNLLSQAS